MKKNAFKTIAWIGVLLLFIGYIVSFYNSWQFMLEELGREGDIGIKLGHMIAIVFGIAGIVLMIIGGLINKPKYLWFASITGGLFYIISFFSIYTQFPGSRIEHILITLSFSFLPGLIAVILGWWLKNPRKKDNTTS
jgi:hypothetical protein